MTIIKVVGFDPSLTNWGIVQANINLDTMAIIPTHTELLSTATEKGVKKTVDRLRRAQYLANEVTKYNPQVIFSEIPTGSQSAVASFALGMVTGILASLITPIIPILPNQTKLASVGSKTATKQQMIDWAVSVAPGLDWPLYRGNVAKKAEHQADALAVIYAGIQTNEFKQLISLYGV